MLNVAILIIPEGCAFGSFELLNLHHYMDSIQTNSINRRLLSLLETEIGTNGLDFKYIEAYVILITYVLRKMGVTKTECKQFINSFADCTNELRVQMSPNVCNQILGTQQRAHLLKLQEFISNS
ncbi:hypothetical protein [Clostridium vitabionis]|uniref:hypothetical protein n=1 Tax=Clostridium vitabionis TaxID=2784388 RepID=UPI00188D4BAB|nr:hypothetical protein [Clostridium vitabionis]